MLHNNKAFKGYTARFDGKWEIVYQEKTDTRKQVLIREKQLKSYRGRESVWKIIKSKFLGSIPSAGGGSTVDI